MCQEHIKNYLSSHTSETTFCVLVESRNNPSLEKEALKQIVINSVPADCGLKVDLKNPGVVFYLTVFKSVAGFTVLPSYYEFKKFNLHSLVGNK